MKRFLWGCAIAALLAAPSFVRAQDEKPEPEDPNTGGLTFTGGADFTTSYFFRGYNQEDTGLIFQPWLTLTTTLVSNDNFTLNGYVGGWNSFHEERTLSGPTGPGAWYESDLYGGIDAVFGKFTVGTVYTFYMYPGGAFETIQEWGFKAGFDDTELMKEAGFAFKPYVGVYFETDDGNGSEDTYCELGVNPTLGLGHGVTLSVPLALGMSLDDYYLDSEGDNETFGYGSIGLFASVPIPGPAKYGAWTFTGGIQYISLFADSAEAVNDGGESDELLGKVGVSFAY